jgi:hypothetical protein
MEADKVTWYSFHYWPTTFINEAMDNQGCYYDSKMVTLETIGLLMPFLFILEQFSGKDVVMHVDNIAVVYGWYNGATKLDEAASILLRALHLMASFLGVGLHVRHEPRRSTEAAALADNLTRKSTTTEADRNLLKGAKVSRVGNPLTSWLEAPEEDWNVAVSFLEEVKNKVKNKK